MPLRNGLGRGLVAFAWPVRTLWEDPFRNGRALTSAFLVVLGQPGLDQLCSALEFGEKGGHGNAHVVAHLRISFANPRMSLTVCSADLINRRLSSRELGRNKQISVIQKPRRSKKNITQHSWPHLD